MLSKEVLSQTRAGNWVRGSVSRLSGSRGQVTIRLTNEKVTKVKD